MFFILCPYLFQPEKHLQRFSKMKLLWMLLKPVPLRLRRDSRSLSCAPQDTVLPLLVNSLSFSGRFPHNTVKPVKAPTTITISLWKLSCISLSRFHLNLWTSLINPQSFPRLWIEKIIGGSWSLVPCCLSEPGDNNLKIELQKDSPAHMRLSCLVVRKQLYQGLQIYRKTPVLSKLNSCLSCPWALRPLQPQASVRVFAVSISHESVLLGQEATALALSCLCPPRAFTTSSIFVRALLDLPPWKGAILERNRP